MSSWQGNSYGEKLLRAEYSRYLKIAKQRLKSLKKAGYDTELVKGIEKWDLIPLRDIKNNRELIFHLSSLDRWLSSKRASVTEQKQIRKKVIETLSKHGYGFVNLDNFDNFALLMEELRKAGLLDIFYAEEDEEEITKEIVEESKNAEDVKNAVNRYQKQKEKNVSRAKVRRRKQQREKERKAAIKSGRYFTDKQQSARNAKKAGKRGRKGKRRR